MFNALSLIFIIQVTDPALRLYMEYSLLEQAMELVIEYVDVVMVVEVHKICEILTKKPF